MFQFNMNHGEVTAANVPKHLSFLEGHLPEPFTSYFQLLISTFQKKIGV